MTSKISSSKDYTVSCFNQNLVFANLSELKKNEIDEIIGDGGTIDGTPSPDDNNGGSGDGTPTIDPDKTGNSSIGDDIPAISGTPDPNPEPILNTCREDGLESTPEEYFTTTSYSYGV